MNLDSNNFQPFFAAKIVLKINLLPIAWRPRRKHFLIDFPNRDRDVCRPSPNLNLGSKIKAKNSPAFIIICDFFSHFDHY